MNRLFKNIRIFCLQPLSIKVDVIILVMLFMISAFITSHLPLKYYISLFFNNPDHFFHNLQPLKSNLSLISKVKNNLRMNTSCLVDSIVTKLFIRFKEGIDVPIYIGVRKGSNGLAAHAWNFDNIDNEYKKIVISHEE